jgi:phosphonate transport system ATP-binding protein
MDTTLPIIQVQRASKAFKPNQLALNEIDLNVYPGECVALLGASGSGKSTLLRTLCGLETFSNRESQVLINGNVLQSGGKLSSKVRSLRKNTAIVFQQFNLVGRKSLIENVLTGCLSRLPLWRLIFGIYPIHERKLALRALESVGLIDYWTQRASTLSGGQQQRAAVARALVQGSNILLADEPVASLDPQSTEKVMTMLQKLNQSNQLTLVISLHDVDLAKRYCSRIVALKDGVKVFDGLSHELTDEVITHLYGFKNQSDANEHEMNPSKKSFQTISQVPKQPPLHLVA